MSVVIVGAGVGGLRTAESLRRKGYTGTVTLVGAEVHRPYSRPPLSKQVLQGTMADPTLPGDLDALDLDLRLGVRAVGVDPVTRAVALDDGSSVAYDALVLAPGAEPRLLPGVGRGDGVHVVRTLDDARGLRAALQVSPRLVVVGGGFIGCEVAASATTMGATVDLVEVLDAPLIRVLGARGSTLVTERLAAGGVRLHTGVGVEALEGSPLSGVRLTDGSTLSTSDVVLGLGVVLDLDWLAGSGIETDDGIVCDAGGRTSLPDVYAVGDAASWHHSLAGRNRRIEHWSVAADHAGVVAGNIVGGTPHENDAVPYFWSDVFDLKIQALGFVDPTHDIAEVPAGKGSALIYSRDGRVTALVGFSAGPRIMRQRAAVASGAPTDEVAAALQA